MLCGHIGAGKDSVARHFIENHNFVNVKMSGDLSRPGSLKRVVWEIFDLDPSKVEDREIREISNPKLGGKTPRQALQYFGHLTRQFFQEVWVNNTVLEIEKHQNDNIVITDIRYWNECDVIKKLTDENTRVVLVAIRNPNLDMTNETYHDASEFSIPMIQERADYTINNNSTLEHLNLQVRLLASTLFS